MSLAIKKRIDELGRLSPEAYAQAEKLPIFLLLDNIRSMHNIGALFRTADAFRLSGLILCGITAKPPQKEIRKTALGAEETVDWLYQSSAVEAAKALQKQGYKLLCLEQCHGSVSLQTITNYLGNRPPLVLVVGHEVHGVQQSVIELADYSVEIPQYGSKHSLNVSVAGAIALWELCRYYLS